MKELNYFIREKSIFKVYGMQKISKFVSKVKRTIEKFGLINPGETVLLGISGGPDSVALTIFLYGLSLKSKLKLVLLHINHKLRGKEAEEDERFVRELAKELELKLICRHINVHKYQRKEKTSLEETARRLRYQAYVASAKKIKAPVVALAHHKDDLAETVLMQLLRGSGRTGLLGFAPKIDIDGIRVIRPFYEVCRPEIMGFLSEFNVGFRLDSSNLDRRFLRNKIRLELIPLLSKEYNPNIVDTLFRTAEIISAEDEYMEKIAIQVYELCAKSKTGVNIVSVKFLSGLHLAILRRFFRYWIQELLNKSLPPTFAEIEELIHLLGSKEPGKFLLLQNRLLVYRDYYHLIADSLPPKKTPGRLSSATLNLAIKELLKKNLPQLGYSFFVVPENFYLTLSNKELNNLSTSKQISILNHQLELSPQEPEKTADDKFTYILELAPEIDEVSFCTPEAKDVVKFRGGAKTLLRYFIDKKIPNPLRENILLLCHKNRVLWIPGIDKFPCPRATGEKSKLIYFKFKT